jgi:NADH dehydrogenase FAD-containing subunit
MTKSMEVENERTPNQETAARSKRRIVILGGGFAGLRALYQLKGRLKESAAEIVLEPIRKVNLSRQLLDVLTSL